MSNLHRVTQDELYNQYFEWLNNIIPEFKPFEDVPGLKFDDVLACSNTSLNGKYACDSMFDLWLQRVYAKDKNAAVIIVEDR